MIRYKLCTRLEAVSGAQRADQSLHGQSIVVEGKRRNHVMQMSQVEVNTKRYRKLCLSCEEDVVHDRVSNIFPLCPSRTYLPDHVSLLETTVFFDISLKIKKSLLNPINNNFMSLPLSLCSRHSRSRPNRNLNVSIDQLYSFYPTPSPTKKNPPL